MRRNALSILFSLRGSVYPLVLSSGILKTDRSSPHQPSYSYRITSLPADPTGNFATQSTTEKAGDTYAKNY